MRLVLSLLIAALLPAASHAAADAAAQQREFEQTLRRTQATIDEAAKNPVPEYLRREVPQKYLDQATEAAARTKDIQRDAIRQSALDSGISESQIKGTALDKKPVNLDAGRIAIFISSSMPKAMLRDLLANSGRDNVSVMLRGLLPGTKNFLETQQQLSELAKGIEGGPDILLNPIAFTNHAVQVVPTVIFAGEKKGEEALRVEGNFNLDFLTRKLAEAKGNPVRLGRLGPVFEVVERDIVEEMKERFASIDWEERARQARGRFWTKQQFVDLPVSRSASVRRIDPTVIVTEDVKNPRDQTQYIAHAGERHNPLEKVPLTRRVIVFDARDPKQLQIVRELRKKPIAGKVDVYITTAIDRDLGWKQHAAISQEFTSPLYLLNNDLKTMMRLRAVPAVVTAEGKQLVIEEIRVPL